MLMYINRINQANKKQSTTDFNKNHVKWIHLNGNFLFLGEKNTTKITIPWSLSDVSNIYVDFTNCFFFLKNS